MWGSITSFKLQMCKAINQCFGSLKSLETQGIFVSTSITRLLLQAILKLLSLCSRHSLLVWSKYATFNILVLNVTQVMTQHVVESLSKHAPWSMVLPICYQTFKVWLFMFISIYYYGDEASSNCCIIIYEWESLLHWT